jgi:hypothetical protein
MVARQQKMVSCIREENEAMQTLQDELVASAPAAALR